jgi:MscS family membrane protein
MFKDLFSAACYQDFYKPFLIGIAIIIFVWLIRRPLSKFIAGLLFRMFHKIAGNTTKAQLEQLVIKPASWFLVLFTTILVLDKIPFPNCWNVSIYNHIKISEFFAALLSIVTIILFVQFILRIIDFFAIILEHKANLTINQNDDQLIVFFKDFFKVIAWIIGLLMIIKFSFKQSIGELLTGLSIVGAAIALATKESLENLIASFIIFFDKPFTTGDIVKVQNHTGTVERIGLRSTRIRTDNKTYVSVPNKQMVDSIVDNQSLRTMRRSTLLLEFAGQAPTETIQELISYLHGLEKQQPWLESDCKLNTHIIDLNKQAIHVEVEILCQPVAHELFLQTKQATIIHIKQFIEENKLPMAPLV